jgi:hypothetical protein
VAFRSGHPHEATIQVVEGGKPIQSKRFQSPARIGRSLSGDFCFPDDEDLAEDHTAIVIREDHWWYCFNINPAAPTFVDGVKIEERFTLIRSGSLVQCGRRVLRVTYLEPGGQFDGSPIEAAQVGQQDDATRLVRHAIERLLPGRDS